MDIIYKLAIRSLFARISSVFYFPLLNVLKFSNVNVIITAFQEFSQSEFLRFISIQTTVKFLEKQTL
jgi:hypothetical protein